MSQPGVEMVGADCGYAGGPVLRDIRVVIEPGGFAGVVGPSAAGKTTLIRR